MADVVDLLQDPSRVEHRANRGLIGRGGAQSDDTQVLEADTKLALLNTSLAAPESDVSAD